MTRASPAEADPPHGDRRGARREGAAGCVRSSRSPGGPRWTAGGAALSQVIDITATTPAGPAAVYALLADGASWPSWSPIDAFELEREGAGAPEGVGAVRRFRNGRVEGRDTIVELVPDRRLGYTHVSSLPVRDYRATVDLEPHGGGTRIRWRASFRPVVPGTGALLRIALDRFLRRCAEGLADRAARPA